MFSELVIHGAIYQARPDVHSVCHHHATPVLPYCITGVELVPVMHLGAALGGKVPFWDSRDEFGDTPLVVTKPEEGASLARALGPHWMVLLRRHGATLAGRSLHECVFRSIYTCRNAELQSRAMGIGSISTLSDGEAQMCSSPQPDAAHALARLGVLDLPAGQDGGDDGRRRRQAGGRQSSRQDAREGFGAARQAGRQAGQAQRGFPGPRPQGQARQEAVAARCAPAARLCLKPPARPAPARSPLQEEGAGRG